MFGKARFSLDDFTEYTRDEVAEWLETLPKDVQDAMRTFGRKCNAQGRDLLLGFQLARNFYERGLVTDPHFIVRLDEIIDGLNEKYNAGLGQPAAAPAGGGDFMGNLMGTGQPARAPGIFGIVQSLLLGNQEARAMRNVSRMDEHQKKVIDQQKYLIDLKRKELEAQGVFVGNKPCYLP